MGRWLEEMREGGEKEMAEGDEEWRREGDGRRR